MSGVPFLDAGLVIAAVAVMLWLTISLLRGSRTQKREVRLVKFARQPWDDDKAGGRGNR